MLVFLTGASSGIGAALAQQYAAQGATLVLLARRQQALQELLACLPEAKAQPHRSYVVDVTDPAALQAACTDCLATLGCPDVVVASAGISAGTLTEYREDLRVFEKILHTNVLGTAATFQPFIAPMKARGSGVLVGLASVAGIRGLPGSEAYSASKAATISYLESLRVELRHSGIKVVTIAPGFIRTPMTAKNPYSMPFLMEVDRFARKAVRAIARHTSYIVIPWQMGLVAKLLRVLPNWIYDRALANATHKPRSGESGESNAL